MKRARTTAKDVGRAKGGTLFAQEHLRCHRVARISSASPRHLEPGFADRRQEQVERFVGWAGGRARAAVRESPVVRRAWARVTGSRRATERSAGAAASATSPTQTPLASWLHSGALEVCQGADDLLRALEGGRHRFPRRAGSGPACGRERRQGADDLLLVLEGPASTGEMGPARPAAGKDARGADDLLHGVGGSRASIHRGFEGGRPRGRLKDTGLGRPDVRPRRLRATLWVP